VTRLGYFPPKWLLLTYLWRAKNPLAGTRQICKKWLFLAFSYFCGKMAFFNQNVATFDQNVATFDLIWAGIKFQKILHNLDNFL